MVFKCELEHVSLETLVSKGHFKRMHFLNLAWIKRGAKDDDSDCVKESSAFTHHTLTIMASSL